MQAAVQEVLDRFAAQDDRDPSNLLADPGPLVLAASAAGTTRGGGARLHEAVLARWLEQLEEVLRSGSLEFGPCGPWPGLAAGARVVPRLGRWNRSLWEQVADGLPEDCWRTSDVRWFDYDAIRGPAAMLLGLVASGRLGASGAAARRQLASRCARHLVALCGDAELASLRLSRDHGDERLRWNEGRVNTGLAHGVAGVVLALKSALEHGLAPASRMERALARACEWLVTNSFVDRTGLRTWPLAVPGDASSSVASPRPQAWCYGTPGIAWSLWEGGRLLGRSDLKSFALGAMRSWCTRAEPRLDRSGDLAGQLGFCHGLAGLLAIADAFARHAKLAPAAARADALEARLQGELDAIVALDDLSLLTGAPGILAVLLTRVGAPRRWLLPLGLR